MFENVWDLYEKESMKNIIFFIDYDNRSKDKLLDIELYKQGIKFFSNISKEDKKKIKIENIKKLFSVNKNLKIVVMNNYETNRNELINYGLKEITNFISYDFLRSLYFFNKKNLIDLKSFEIKVGNLCNLKCINCSNYIPMSKNEKFNPKKEIDLLFSYVDYLDWISVIGGEPFLHEELEDTLVFLGKNHSKKIREKIVITTNGTIIPDYSVLEIIGNYNFQIDISDYSDSNIKNYENMLSKTIRRLEETKVKYRILNKKWRIPDIDKNEFINLSEEEKRNHYIDCAMPCKTIRNSKFYSCSCATEAYQIGLSYPYKDEVLDLTEKVSKKQFFEHYYYQYFHKSGYLSHCLRCRGRDPKYFIEAIPGQQS